MRGLGRASPWPHTRKLHRMRPMYQLSPYVFACTTGRHCMFLDLHRDRYLSVQQPLMQSLAPQIDGWLDHDAVSAQILASPEEIAQLADDLVSTGVLRPYDGSSQSSPTHPPKIDGDFRSLPPRDRAAVPHSFSISALAALASADFALRTIPLWRIIHAISRRSSGPISADQPARTEQIGHLAACFRDIRPWYPRNYLCLFDSFALTLFLLRNGVPTQWTFAVREEPFAAHCWVQHGTVVLNDYLDKARTYTPIMSI